MQELNVSIFQFFNNLTSSPLISYTTPFLADFPIFFLPVFLVGYWIYYSFYQKDTQKKLGLIYIFLSCVIAHTLSIIIQQFVYLERPETAITSAGKLLLEHIPDASFPSDHASVWIAFLLSIFLMGYKKTAFALLPWMLLMLFSRIIVGVHWPFDIIAGIIIGLLAWYIGSKMLPKIKFVKNINLWIIQILSYIKL